jgi:vacuolar protein sorting-associated protein 13A/C
MKASFCLDRDLTKNDPAFKPSEFAIINADAHSDFDLEKRLLVRDQQDRKMDLRLNYV